MASSVEMDEVEVCEELVGTVGREAEFISTDGRL